MSIDDRPAEQIDVRPYPQVGQLWTDDSAKAKTPDFTIAHVGERTVRVKRGERHFNMTIAHLLSPAGTYRYLGR